MKKLLVSVLLAILIMGLLSSCSQKTDGSTTTTTTNENTEGTTSSGTTTTTAQKPPDDYNKVAAPDYAEGAFYWEATLLSGMIRIDSEYRIITENGNSAASGAGSSLRAAIKNAIGENLGMSTSRIDPGSQSYYESEKEILVGSVTNRIVGAEIKEKISDISGYCGEGVGVFYIGASDDKIIIYSDDQVSVRAAVDFFIKNVVKGKTDILLNGDLSSLYIFDKQLYNRSQVFSMLSTESIDSSAEALSITVDRAALTGFSASVYTYDVTRYRNQTYPTIAVKAYSGKTSVSIVQPNEENGGHGTVTMRSADGKTEHTYSINVSFLNYSLGEYTLHEAKDGAKGIVTLVQDDGFQDTTDFMLSVCRENGLKMNVAMIANKIGSLDKDGNDNYIIDENGNYSITLKSPTASVSGGGNVKYWTDLIAANSDVIEISGHSLTHGSWGMTEENVKAEIIGCQQILQKAFPGQDVLTFAYPGFSSSTRLQEYEYARTFMQGKYTAARFLSTGKKNMLTNPTYLNLECCSLYYPDMATLGAGAENTDGWLMKRLADSAENGGWVVTMNHMIAKTNEGLGKGNMTIDREYFNYVVTNYIMPYVNEGKLWSAFFSEASLYVTERSNASVICREYDDKYEVILTDTVDDELYDYPLTLDIKVADGWNNVTLSYFDRSGAAYTEELTAKTAEDGSLYVRINIVPDCGVATITQK